MLHATLAMVPAMLVAVPDLAVVPVLVMIGPNPIGLDGVRQGIGVCPRCTAYKDHRQRTPEQNVLYASHGTSLYV